MSYSYDIKEVLNDYEGVLYKMIRIRIISDSTIFEHRALSQVVRVVNGANSIVSFEVDIPGNQRELHAHFTTDAFTGYAGLSEIHLGYGGEFDNGLNEVITNVDLSELTPLVGFASDLEFEIADSSWLSSL